MSTEGKKDKYTDEGVTPWGTKYISYFKDKDGNACNEDEAVEFHIHEYDNEGNWLNETIGYADDRQE